MTPFLLVLHTLVCVFLIISVLLQPGARGGVGAAFGGAGGATVFGGRGANTFLAKLTAASAVIFMLTSISLSYFVSRSGSVMSGRASAGASDDAKDEPTEEPTDGAKEAPAAVPGDAAAVPGDAAAKPAEAAPAPSGVNPVETPPLEKPASPPLPSP